MDELDGELLEVREREAVRGRRHGVAHHAQLEHERHLVLHPLARRRYLMEIKKNSFIHMELKKNSFIHMLNGLVSYYRNLIKIHLRFAHTNIQL